MSNRVSKTAGKAYSLDDDEFAVVEFYRALRLGRDEALRRLATPSTSPILPQGQELQSNMAAVAQDPMASIPATDPPTTS